jgi:hypothetical protein
MRTFYSPKPHEITTFGGKRVVDITIPTKYGFSLNGAKRVWNLPRLAGVTNKVYKGGE